VDPSRRRRILVNALRFALSGAILAHVIEGVRSEDPETFARLLGQPKDWSLLCLAWACCATALGVGYMRWHVLIRGLGLRSTPTATLRIGVFAFMLDFAALGAAGGDLVKVVLLARQQHSSRGVEAAATVVADRVVGLLMMTSTAACVLWWNRSDLPQALQVIAGFIGSAAIGAWLAVAALFAALSLRLADESSLSRLGKIGFLLARLVEAARMYRRHPAVLLLACLLALTALTLNVTGFFLLAKGFPAVGPSWPEHWRIVPTALLSGLIPLPADALGVFDYAVSQLYVAATDGRASEGLGLLVVMSYRVVSIGVAAIGLVLYTVSRKTERDRFALPSEGSGPEG
jgi:hypothetical protein